jgi:hypothetical protein
MCQKRYAKRNNFEYSFSFARSARHVIFQGQELEGAPRLVIFNALYTLEPF